MPHKPFTNCSPADGGAGQSSAAGGTGIQRLCLFSGVCGSTGRGRRAGTQAWSSVCAACIHPATSEGLEPLPPTFFLLPYPVLGMQLCQLTLLHATMLLPPPETRGVCQQQHSWAWGGGTAPVLCALGQSQPNTLAFV